MLSTDDQAIFSETAAFAQAWNMADAKVAASFFTDDAVRVGAFGDIQHGRTEIEAAYDKLLHHTMLGATVQQDRGTIRYLSPELAVWQAGIEITPQSGSAPMKGHVVQVMKKTAGRWLVLESHPKVIPDSPAQS